MLICSPIIAISSRVWALDASFQELFESTTTCSWLLVCFVFYLHVAHFPALIFYKSLLCTLIFWFRHTVTLCGDVDYCSWITSSRDWWGSSWEEAIVPSFQWNPEYFGPYRCSSGCKGLRPGYISHSCTPSLIHLGHKLLIMIPMLNSAKIIFRWHSLNCNIFYMQIIYDLFCNDIKFGRVNYHYRWKVSEVSVYQFFGMPCTWVSATSKFIQATSLKDLWKCT